MPFTCNQIINFLVDNMGYDADQLEGLDYEDLTDGLDMEVVAAYIS